MDYAVPAVVEVAGILALCLLAERGMVVVGVVAAALATFIAIAITAQISGDNSERLKAEIELRKLP